MPILKLLQNRVKKTEKAQLSVFLSKCYFVKKNENKVIIACDYDFHRKIFIDKENSLIIEKELSEIFNEKIVTEFIMFEEAVERKYTLALDEVAERKKIEERIKKGSKFKDEILEERKQKIRISRIESRIPLRFKEVELKDSLKVIQDYCSDRKYKKRGFFLYGGFGTGKTYNAYALLKHLIMNDVDAWAFNLPRLLNIIRASFSKQEAYNESTGESSYAFVKNMSDIEKLIDVEVLIVDDIGAEKPSDWVAETLYYLINSRYENRKTTIFTSNLNLDGLVDKVGDRIVSRIMEMCVVYRTEGEDKRMKK